ncbi:MAG: 3-mercaptopyruvate sulfurtransferase [Pseudomonadota bacterium]
MAESSGRWIVDTAWLAEHLDAPDVVVLDGSWHLPTAERDPKADYAAAHLPDAQFFDIDDIADEASPLPHMLPSTIKFASRVKKMGIGDGMRVVVYDAEGSNAAARVWWMFRVMGHHDVVVLDGGMAKWRAEGRPVDDLPPRPRTPRHFTPRFNASLVQDADDVLRAVERETAQIIDARAAARFRGEAPEPRAGLRSGHMPGALNLPYELLYNEDRTYKSPEDLRALFDQAGIDRSQPIVTSCGSGVTACIVALGLAIAGQPNAAVYDGSWTEWGGDERFPVITG